MIVERIGILVFSVILMIMLCAKYIKRYNPINLIFVPLASFINSIYLYLIIYNLSLRWYFSLIIYFFNIIIPLFLVLLQYNNIILKRQIIYYLMKCMYKSNEYSKTIKYITKLVNMEGRTSEYMYILGKCYKAQDDYINARDSFAIAIELNPKDYKSIYEFALILDETNKKEVACAMFSKALKINQEFYEAAEALGISYTSQGKFKKAVYVYNKMIKKFPKAYEIYYNIGMLEMELGNYDRAIDAFGSCSEIKPDLYMAHYNIAKLKFIKEEYDEAILSYRKILHSKLYGSKAYYKIACIFAIKKEYEKSMANLEYAVELDENYLDEAKHDSYFNNMKDLINDFSIAREIMLQKKKQSHNFMNERLKIFKNSKSIKLKISA